MHLPYIIILRVLLIGFRMAVPKQHALQFGDVRIQKWVVKRVVAGEGTVRAAKAFLNPTCPLSFIPAWRPSGDLWVSVTLPSSFVTVTDELFWTARLITNGYRVVLAQAYSDIKGQDWVADKPYFACRTLLTRLCNAVFVCTHVLLNYIFTSVLMENLDITGTSAY